MNETKTWYVYILYIYACTITTFFFARHKANSLVSYNNNRININNVADVIRGFSCEITYNSGLKSFSRNNFCILINY